MARNSTTATSATERRQRGSRATSDELVDAALRVIAREGVQGATTRKIADEAGVPLGTVHYWYAGKAELLADVIRVVIARIQRAVDSTDRAHDGSAADARMGLHAAWVEIVGDDPGAQLGMYELTTLALRSADMRGLASEQYRSYRHLAARSVAEVFTALDADRAELLAELIAVTFDGLCLAWLADPEGSRPTEVLDLLADLITQSVAAATA
jgi:AcrR family transcriptional regulator